MVLHARDLLHLLPELAAEGDVHFLEATADREQGQARGDDVRNERQRRRVTMRIVQRVRIAGRPRIAMRLDIRRAAREQDAVQRPEQLVEVTLTQRRNQQRDGVGRFRDRGDVLLPDTVEGVRAEDPAIRGNPDQWFAARHV